MSNYHLSESIGTLVTRRRRWLLVALLALLHLVLTQGPDTAFGHVVFVVEIGLAILWQPFVRAERRLSALTTLTMVTGVALAAYWLNWWILVAWVMLSAGIVGGKVFFYSSRWTKMFYLLALGYLVIALVLVVLPHVVPEAVLPNEFAVWIPRLLPGLLLVMAVLPEEKESEEGSEAIDFIYSVFVFLLLAVLALGSLAAMELFKRGYVESLFEALLTLGLLLLALGWAWNPHAGFAGLGTLFSRYLLSIGLPLEQWLHALADLAQHGDDPQTFLNEACRDMVRRLPWIKGGDWSDGEHGGEFGLWVGDRTEFRHGSLTLGIYTVHPSPALMWHFNLLAQLLAEFYDDKRRVRELKYLSYVQAIHETGARLTHDVKNLLQSLNTLCAAFEADRGAPSAELMALLGRQLPVIVQRLDHTLEKLQVPREDGGETVTAKTWFDSISNRYFGQGVHCEMKSMDTGCLLPAALFDSVAENLVQNAIDKRRQERSLHIRLELGQQGEKPVLEVVDDGAAIAPAEARRLLREPVVSENGLGIGLYQVARQAELNGYRLQLAENSPGSVRFSLTAAS